MKKPLTLYFVSAIGFLLLMCAAAFPYPVSRVAQGLLATTNTTGALAYLGAAPLAAPSFTGRPTIGTGRIPYLTSSGTHVTVTNTASESVLYTNTVAAGALGTTGSITVKLRGIYIINNGTPTVTIAVYYGATQIYADATSAFSANANFSGTSIEVIVSAAASTGAQDLYGTLELGGPGSATTGLSDLSATKRLARTPFAGSATEDSTLAKGLGITITFSASGANSYIVNHTDVEVR
jgi:hypothetical protein